MTGKKARKIPWSWKPLGTSVKKFEDKKNLTVP